MNKLKCREISLAVLNSGLVNSNACIKNLGTSFICCCDNCLKGNWKKMGEIIDKINDKII